MKKRRTIGPNDESRQTRRLGLFSSSFLPLLEAVDTFGCVVMAVMVTVVVEVVEVVVVVRCLCSFRC
jgi:Fe2+ transport system protein B